MADLTVSQPVKSPLAEAQDSGKAVVAGKERKVVAAGRKSKEGKEAKAAAESKRLKDQALFKATLKKDDAGSGDDEWEDIEEDFPHVKLEELLDNLKLDDGAGSDEEVKE